MRYKYIHFVVKSKTEKTKIWSCRNNLSGKELGIVKWNSQWRQYCYYPTIQAVYSMSCMEDIIHFINWAMVMKNHYQNEPAKRQ